MVDTRNLSVMFTDIKGFTARTSRSSREDLISLLKKHEEIVLPLASARGGALIKTIGDAFLFTFESSTNALLAGVEVQAAMRDHNASVDKGSRFEIRIGINSGEVTIIDGDVYGDAVNIASRIESIAEPNQIFFSETVFLTVNKRELDVALGQNALQTAEVGYKSLKGVAEKIRVYKIAPTKKPAGLRTIDFAEDAAAGLGRESSSPADPALSGPAGSALVLGASGGLELDLEPLAMQGQRQGMAPETKRPTGPSPRASRVTSRGGAGDRLIGRGRMVLQTLAWLGFIGVGLGIAATSVLHSIWFAVTGVLLLCVVHPFYFGFGHSRVLLLRLIAAAAVPALIFGFGAYPLHEVQARLDGIANELRSGEATSLSTADSMAIYVVHLGRAVALMSTGSTEAGSEQLLLAVGGGEERFFKSEFAMAAPTVTRPLADFVKPLRVAWHKGVKQMTMPVNQLRPAPPLDPRRVALALDPLELHALAVRDAKGWLLTVMGRVWVSHPSTGEIRVLSFGGVDLTIQRSLLWTLQQTGWLTPYSAVWTWKLRANDPRLTILAQTR